MKRVLSALTPLLFSAVCVGAEEVNLAVLHKIKAEAFQGSQVMDHLFYLTDVNGPRLTASPGFQAAADWATARLSGWGLASVKQETWGRFGRSWSLKRFSAHMTAPTYAPLLGMPKAWSSGTNGAVSGEVVSAPLFESWQDEERGDLLKLRAHVQQFIEQQKGKLAGKVVLIEPLRELPLPSEAPSKRLDDAKLAELATAPEPFKAPSYERPLLGLPGEPKRREQDRKSVV